MSALITITDAGVQVSIESPDGLKLKGLSKLTVEQKNQIINHAQKYKYEILAALKTGAPGDCHNCPAAGYWDHLGPGRWCFHRAYFLGKSGTPTPCAVAKTNCPLK